MTHQLAALALALCSGSAANNDSELPTPTGPAPVGTAIAYLVDATRKEPDFPNGRPITVQLWYPIDGARAQQCH